MHYAAKAGEVESTVSGATRPEARAVRGKPARGSRLAALVLAAAFVDWASPMAALGQTGDQVGTQPSVETVRSLIMSNWTDSVAIHYARQLAADDPHLFGPYLSGLHDAADWPVNQIDGATAFFRTEVLDGGHATGPERPASLCESSGEPAGDDAPADPGVRQSYPTVMCFDDDGVLNVEYLRETERNLPIQIEKAYAMVPNQPFVVARYTVINNIPPEDNRRVRVRLAEVVDLNNKAALDHEESAEDLVDTGIHEPQPDQPVNEMHATWHPELNAWIADMSASNGVFLVFGAFDAVDRHRVLETVSDEIEFDRAVGAEIDAVEQPDPAPDVDQLTAKDLALALWKEVVLEPEQSQQLAFFYAVTPSAEEAEEVAAQARRHQTADPWFDETAMAYQDWLRESQAPAAPDAGLDKAYTRVLITTRQAQQPEFGSFVAATNPAYGFKVWPRDSSVTALGLAAAGRLEEAMKYYRWMASVQEDGSLEEFPAGTWYSNYSYWLHKRPKHFVEPEWDSLGLFMIGVFHTWRLLNERDPQAARAFLTEPLQQTDQGPATVYEAVRRSADFIASNLTEHGFGPADHSIWEEDFQWNTFTQVTYASGLNAARLLAEQMGETDRAGTWLDGGRRVLDAIHRSATAQPCPGLWNDAETRWNRATWPDCTVDDRLDASSNLVWVFGLVDAADPRAASQREATLSTLTPGEDDIGIARYEGDEFYYQSPFSPGGEFEASAQLPSWPQMDMYVAMLEHWLGMNDVALERLTWYVRVTNAGYVPPGEGVDWPTDRPLPSTAAEPVTGAWYVLALLNYLDLFDPRLPPLEGPGPAQ